MASNVFRIITSDLKMSEHEDLEVAILATDLDGTFIPLEGEPGNTTALQTFDEAARAGALSLVFVTGRHLELVEDAINVHRLPRPNWIICDVGTSIYTCEPGGPFRPLEAYRAQLAELVHGMSVEDLADALSVISTLRLQEPEKQGPFKLSYYVEQRFLETVASEVETVLVESDAPYSLVQSVDPFTNDGLIDLLPRGVSKAYALEWWCRHQGLEMENVVFAGDSGNDWAALVAGYRAIVVGNAPSGLVERVREEHACRGYRDRLFIAAKPATSGVLDGCKWFGLIDEQPADSK